MVLRAQFAKRLIKHANRSCKIQPEIIRNGLLKGIKHWAIDKFHATGHNSACKCSPLCVPSIARRLKHVNTSVAEQVFSWFRGYALTFNELRKERHVFLVLYYCKRHNLLLDNKGADYLNKYAANKSSKRATRGYACQPSQRQKRADAAKKKQTAMKAKAPRLSAMKKNLPIKKVAQKRQKVMKLQMKKRVSK